DRHRAVADRALGGGGGAEPQVELVLPLELETSRATRRRGGAAVVAALLLAFVLVCLVAVVYRVLDLGRRPGGVLRVVVAAGGGGEEQRGGASGEGVAEHGVNLRGRVVRRPILRDRPVSFL